MSIGPSLWPGTLRALSNVTRMLASKYRPTREHNECCYRRFVGLCSVLTTSDRESYEANWRSRIRVHPDRVYLATDDHRRVRNQAGQPGSGFLSRQAPRARGSSDQSAEIPHHG